MIQRNAATEAQVKAARPDTSTWLAANAGSGKTRVLTDRVARLLLEGVEPQHILCLTYTKAAASEMQNRLFDALGKWAMQEDAALTQALQTLGVDGQIDGPRLRSARTLFARAIETPGGLKIQTIHSFCAALLRRFPLEAGVSPQFTEIEDRAADLLRADIISAMAETDEDGVIADLARHFSGDDLSQLAKGIVGHRSAFAAPLDRAAALALFDQPSTLCAEHIETAAFLGEEQALLGRIMPPMLEKGGNDEKAALKLASCGPMQLSCLPLLESVFLTGAKAAAPFSAKAGSFPTKATRAVLAGDMPALDAFMQRIEAARAQRLALAAAEKTAALHGFAARFLPLYETAKIARGWLDFDDLIDRARGLLSDTKVANWVLWRIDGGIDHILVDEAQDTSPAQWDVIRKLAAEFTSGQGARPDTARTIFVVGDKKQSIYSFQGADPRQFDEMRAEFKQKLEDAQRSFQTSALAYSFRSSKAVLDLVDNAFTGQAEAGFGTDAPHIAFKDKLPGRVDLWPVIEPQKADDDPPWYDPLDRKSPLNPTVLLAERIAERIAEMCARPALIPDDAECGGIGLRPVRAGDFLILVQTRGPLFSEIIRACKARDLPIAGADRLKVGGELAVRDLAALLSFLAVPEDSLSLACALRSPLFGWSEQMLFDLAHRRDEEHLWQALRAQGQRHADTMHIIADLRRNIDFLRPYDLIERILTRHGGRRKLLARLGTEAEDGIDALLSQALAFERTSIPSLTGFLSWMETDDLEIKRQIDSRSDQIRVMTVHGAKGLEAPIVILPDCAARQNAIKNDIVLVGDTPTWKVATDDAPPAMAAAVNGLKKAQEQERLRLLYVALTRAEKWLIVAAAGELSKDGNTWYQRIEAAINAEATQLVEDGGVEIRRMETGDWTTGTQTATASDKPQEVVLPGFYREMPPVPIVAEATIAPSDLDGAKALPGEAGRDEDQAKAYGTLVHRFLEHLAITGDGAGSDLASGIQHPDLSAADHRLAEAEARAVIADPTLRPLFGPDGLSEVPVTAPFGPGQLYGVIDRLIVSEETVLAVDFKTNRTVPERIEDCPIGILRQMAAYQLALQQIYADHRVGVAVLWTARNTIMRLPHDIVMASLESTPYLDAGRGAP